MKAAKYPLAEPSAPPAAQEGRRPQSPRLPTRVCDLAQMPVRTGSDAVAEVVARGGIEPPTRGFSVRCSTN